MGARLDLKLKTIHADAKNDCAAWIENMLYCDPMQSKTVKFVHRMNKVIDSLPVYILKFRSKICFVGEITLPVAYELLPV